MKVSLCNDISDNQLFNLLSESEEQLDSSALAKHVEECPRCQRRLAKLTASQAIADEASHLLRGFAGADAGSTGRQSHSRFTEENDALHFDRDMLSPPSHPEMLGRIGRYEVERCIGAGGMGVVFKAFDTELNRPVAVKVLASHLARNGAARQRFNRESRAAASVAHENVVAIHNVESDNKYPYLVMQFVQGESLQARVDREGPLSPERLLQIGLQTALGLGAAHQQGIIHRDIKPANILLEDGIDRLLITDFGLARMVDDASLTHTGTVVGTPNYMSPEQAKGDGIDVRTDLFSLGAVLYFAATGHPPFRAESAMGVLNRICQTPHRPVWQVNPSIPDGLCRIIDRLLEKSPSKRYSNAGAIAESITKLMQQKNIRRPSLSKRFTTRLRRSPGLTAALASLLSIAGGAVIWFGLNPHLPANAPENVVNEMSMANNDNSKPFDAPGGSSEGALSSEESAANSISVDATLLSAGTMLESDFIESLNDRSEFDTELDSIRSYLHNQSMNSLPTSAVSAGGFARELKAIETSLDQLQP